MSTVSNKVCEDWCGIDIDCADHNAEKFGDPEDCTKYYECWNLDLLHRDCPEGLVFDCESKVCNWDYESTCQTTCPTEQSEIST